MNTKNNQRFLQTEQKIEQTFLQLCKHKSAEKITVSQLCKAVNINRSTFYEHYLDIPDLIQKTGVKYIIEIQQLLYIPKDYKDFPLTPQYLIPLFTYIEQHQDFFEIFLNQTNPQTLEDSFSKLLLEACAPYLSHFADAPSAILEYHLTFFRSGFVAILRRWVQFGCKEKPEDLAKILLQNLPVASTVLF